MKRWTDREPREYSTLGGVSASASLWIKQYFSSSFNLSERVIEFTSMNARVFGIFFKQYGIPPYFFVRSIWLIICRARCCIKESTRKGISLIT